MAVDHIHWFLYLKVPGQFFLSSDYPCCLCGDGILCTLLVRTSSPKGRNDIDPEPLALFHPWRQEYVIIAKMRKVTGPIATESGVGKETATYYWPANDIDTLSLSRRTDTDMGSRIDSRV